MVGVINLIALKGKYTAHSTKLIIQLRIRAGRQAHISPLAFSGYCIEVDFQ
jgi:hypothetical protein